jgi:hypothetical protein
MTKLEIEKLLVRVTGSRISLRIERSTDVGQREIKGFVLPHGEFQDSAIHGCTKEKVQLLSLGVNREDFKNKLTASDIRTRHKEGITVVDQRVEVSDCSKLA